jgi:hypothetical protein
MMPDIQRCKIPPGYNHKATSESFTGTDKVVIYYSSTAGDYLVVAETQLNEDIQEQGWYFTETQLKLIIHAGTDVLHDAQV